MRLFDFFPLISFIVLGLMISQRIIFLKKKNVSVGSKSKKSTVKNYILYPVFLVLFILLIFELIKPPFQISFSILPEWFSKNIIDSNALKIFGVIFILFSLTLMRLTLLSFKKSLRFGLASNNLGKLVTNGVFSYSRNPFFISIELYLAGTALLFPNPFFNAILLLAMVSIHLFILKEEKFLTKNYGQEYENYLKKVRRYF